MTLPAVRQVARRVPGAQRTALRARFGDLGRTAPLTQWAQGRGTPVDRWYIDRYLLQHSDVVHGRVLEIKSDQYASALGAAEVEVVDIDPDNPRVTLVADLCEPGSLPRARYDAAIVTQTLQLVPDPAAAVRNLLSSLRPGGALLLTVPCLSQVCPPVDRWRYLPLGFAEVLQAQLGPGASLVEVRGMGNGLAARAFLFGLAAEDLPETALGVDDANLPLVVGALVRSAR